MSQDVHALIYGESPVRLWGLSSGRRLTRMLARAGVTRLVRDAESVPDRGTVLILRGDYLFDDRVIRRLAETTGIVLAVASGREHVPVAVHVPSGMARRALDVLCGGSPMAELPGVRVEEPDTLSSSYQEHLSKLDPPVVLPITPEGRRDLERRLFSGSYKGVTDLVTKWVWPRPAQWVTGVCVRLGLRPNHVTTIGLLLAVAAGICFAYGAYGWGLAAGWLMTFLDTVDGKLARVTVDSSRFGHLFDHVIDLVHPPLWYAAWGLGLPLFHPVIPGIPLGATVWLIVAGYVAGRLVEGAFLRWMGTFGIFCWRPVDSYFRLITARRNPNLLLLTAGAASGRPDLGLSAVAVWTVLTSLFLLARLAMAVRARIVSPPLRSWFFEIGRGVDDASLAVRLFTNRPVCRGTGVHE